MRVSVEVKKRKKFSGRYQLKFDQVEVIAASAYLADAVEAFSVKKK